MSLTVVSEKINAAMNRRPAPQHITPSTVFLSHSHADAEAVRQLDFVLRKFGFTSWWSALLQPGDSYRNEIVQRLSTAFAVIVLWTPTSIHSQWVVSEAARGLDRGVLVPVRASNVDEGDIPPPFDTLHTLTSDNIAGLVDTLEVLKNA